MQQINRYRSSMANHPTPPKAKTIRSKIRRALRGKKYVHWVADLLEQGLTMEQIDFKYKEIMTRSLADTFGFHPTKVRYV